jgi:hypothetical protein
MLFGIPSIYAAGITIGNGSTLALNGASMSLGCLDITIEGGGTLDLGSGGITRLKNLNISNGGIFIQGTGTISRCLTPAIFELLLLQ